eukprot:7592780-Pyramimonas_sp.AAC.1
MAKISHPRLVLSGNPQGACSGHCSRKEYHLRGTRGVDAHRAGAGTSFSRALGFTACCGTGSCVCLSWSAVMGSTPQYFCCPFNIVSPRPLESSIPFCAFNGGNDVFVDVGNKSLGLEALMRYLKCDPVRPPGPLSGHQG